MKRATIRRTLPVFILTGGIAPTGSALAATHTPLHANKTAKAKQYKGPLVDMRWGPVQAAIAVKGKKITNVKISTLPENFRSQFIDQQAVPLLKQETLQAQSANIDTVSGATLTSEAYIQSLQGALKKAHL